MENIINTNNNVFGQFSTNETMLPFFPKELFKSDISVGNIYKYNPIVYENPKCNGNVGS